MDVYESYRQEFRARVLSGRPRSILEVGSGDGDFLKTVTGEVERLAGLDPDGKHFAALRALGFEQTKGSAERLPFDDGEFDVVAFSFAPHHVTDWPAALTEALRVARRSVEILDIWYDDTVADQRTTHALDRWLKTIDRRTGMVHNDTLSPDALLEPVRGRRDLAFDYVCRRIVAPTDIGEMRAHGLEYLKKVDADPELAAELERVIADAQRDGVTDEGSIQMTIAKSG